MNLNKVKESFAAVLRLLPKNADPAFMNQVISLGEAILEADSMPKQYVNTNAIQIPNHWSVWPENLGYYENPYVRTDGVVLFKLSKKSPYYAKYANGQFMLDTKQRKKFWKYAITAMVYIDRDNPVK